MIGYDLIRALASFLYDSFWYYLSVCWLYTQTGCKMTVVILGFIFTHNIQRKGVLSLLMALLKVRKLLSSRPQQISFLISVYQVSHSLFLNQFLDQGVSWTAWLWLGS